MSWIINKALRRATVTDISGTIYFEECFVDERYIPLPISVYCSISGYFWNTPWKNVAYQIFIFINIAAAAGIN